MKAETILQSNLLDIIFENRNKEYGAYPLRKYYSNRLYQAITFMLTLITFFSVLMSWDSSTKKSNWPLWVSDTIILTSPLVDKVISPTEKIVKPKIKTLYAGARTNVQQIERTIPLITRDTTIVTTIPALMAIDKAKVGLSNSIGTLDNSNLDDQTQTEGRNSVKGEQKVEPRDEIMDEEFVEKLPEFPGGKPALMRYLLKNINQPTDLEVSDKLEVIAEFVVNKNGEIENVVITKHTRKDLEEDITKVIRQMPLWKPGIQNGRTVSVYLSLPITFVANESY